MSTPSSSSQNRRLSAVMFLDMVGYSALMARSESLALARLKDLEAILRKEIPEAGGRLVKLLGDGSLAEFPTAAAAVRCAQNILSAIEARNGQLNPGERFGARIGLHLGELVEEKGDIFGDAVNIAARVQPVADPGAIAMTGTVHAQVRNQMSLRGVYLPPKKLKNIQERMRIFLTPPPDAYYPFWALCKKGIPAAAGAALLAAAVGLGGWAAFRHLSAEPNRMGILIVKTAESETAKDMAVEIQDELDMRGARIKGAQWVNREGVLDLFQQVGIEDPEAIENLEVKACSAARKGGLGYSLSARLHKLTGGRWRLSSKIICTRTRTVVGAFDVEGDSSKGIAEKAVAQLQEWVSRSLYVEE